VYDQATFCAKTRLFAGLDQIRASRLLVVGYTQQWVVSATVNQRKIEDKFGILVTHIGIEELMEEFHSTERSQVVQTFATEYLQQAVACLEPTTEQIEDAYRLYLALASLLSRYGCNALAISCFSLVKSLGVTACLALSLLNDDARFVAACEGDLDAAVSMIIGKSLTELPVFMGNPVFNRNNTLDLVHCTAPRRLLGDAIQPFTVRSHHETGKSVAQKVEVVPGTKATLFRIGNELEEATLYEATLVDNPRADTCRTQFRFAIDSTDKRLSEVLGCHQLVVFGEQEKLLRDAFEKYLQITVR
jgi:L-fucose isomerase-like protein